MPLHIMNEADRCYNCKKPMCQEGCPVHTPIPQIIQLFKQHKLMEAGEILFNNNPLSAICSEVCDHAQQCAGHCIRKKKDSPVHFSSIENYISEMYLDRMSVQVPEHKRNKKVAVIGAGPAGITVAITLAREGYPVTIFEWKSKIGGVMQYGIPEFRLPKTIIDRYENILEAMGIQIRLNATIGSVLMIDDLFRDGYQTIFVGTGAERPRTLGIKGESFGNVHFAMNYLANPKAHHLGQKVAVIGVGNAAMDVARTALRNGSKEFSLVEGAYATITFTPDEGYRMKSLSVNGEDMTSFVASYQYVVSRIAKNTLVEVEFVKDIVDLAFAGINYKVVSNREQTVNVASGDYGQVLTIPNVFTVDGREWKVVGVEAGALAGMTDLAAIFWNAEAEFNGSVSNPNLLLYVKAAQYASSSITNVIVDNIAENIVLTDAASGNNFYCPQAFTAKNITYEHNYSMISGYNTCQGWETLVLPFDVTKIVRQGNTELVPYQAWTQGSSQRPFWLYSLTELGWKAESAIVANTPYIISMPNNENYNPIYNISGNIQFVGINVQVKATEGLTSGKNGNKKLTPCYQNQDAGNGIWALNVNNLWSKNTDTALEGSAFIQSLRSVHPFEADMTTEGAAAARRVIPVFGDGDATGIADVRSMMSELRGETWYTLDGRKLQEKPTTKGVYIQNGRKVVVK